MFDKRLIITISTVLTILMVLLLFVESKLIVDIVFIIALLKLIIVDKFKYYNPSVSFIVPWIVLYSFQKMSITIYSRDIDFMTWKLMAIPVLLSSIIAPDYFKFRSSANAVNEASINDKMFKYAYIICYALFFANVVYSGYLPLVSLLKDGNSDYMDYGIKGINGLFYAYSNAFGLLCYYLYNKTKDRKYLYFLLSIFFIFLVCITRQNIISLVFEILIVHTIQIGPINIKRVMLYGLGLILLFSILGQLRSGDIKELVGLKDEYYWIPTAFLWIYSYGFFNILNLDNLVHDGYYGLFDGSSLSSLIPSFLRPDYGDSSSLLEVSNFTISSYINPIFQDFGYYGVMIFTLITVVLTVINYKKAITVKSFRAISIYSVLFFCALFSFFVNFWFYLPIIFQIPFLIIFNKKIFISNNDLGLHGKL